LFLEVAYGIVVFATPPRDFSGGLYAIEHGWKPTGKKAKKAK